MWVDLGGSDADELDCVGDGAETVHAHAPARSEPGVAGDIGWIAWCAVWVRVAAVAAVGDPPCWCVVCKSCTNDVNISAMTLVQCDGEFCDLLSAPWLQR